MSPPEIRKPPQGGFLISADTGAPAVGGNNGIGNFRIGYGYLVKPGEDFINGITEQQAIALLRSDIATAERVVQDNITAQMSQTQYDALVSLAYNIGTSGFKNSTVVKYINNPDFHSSVYSDLESAWKAWNRTQGKVSNGLINRRQNEWNLYKRGIY